MGKDASGQLLVDPKILINNKDPPKRRRFRKCRSAPLAQKAPEGVTFNPSLSHSHPLLDILRPSFRKVIILLAVYIGIGTICFYFVRKQISGKKTNGIIDAVYFTIVTMTSVGYGDLAPNSSLTKLLACAFVFAGFSIIGLVLTKAADYLVDKQERLLVNTIHMGEKYEELQMTKVIQKNKMRNKCIVSFVILLALIVSGTLFLVFVEKLGFVDAFYCVCATITTLGYCGTCFSTKAGRIFSIFWILLSPICMAQFIFYIAELHTETKQRALVKSILSRRVTNFDLEAADLDNDGVVEAAEFVIYKLKEMGKITEEDVSLVLKEFEELDIDQTGTLSAADITLSQLSP